jgi:hypothetical protein
MNIILSEISKAIGLVIGGCVGISISIVSIIGIMIVGMLIFDLVDIIRIAIYKWSHK